MDLAPNVRPPVCLQYITWSHAASVSDKYHNLHELFYQRARKYAELEEMRGLGEGVLSLAVCQTWLLIGTYEFRMMCFPRAWLSVGKACRLALMLGLNRIDGLGHGMKQTLPVTSDWTEKEERRRVFWMAYCVDRYASVGTGWPILIDDRDVSRFSTSFSFLIRRGNKLTEKPTDYDQFARQRGIFCQKPTTAAYG